MTSINEWIENIKLLGTEQIKDLVKSFNVVLNWRRFNDEYGWTGVRVVRDLLEQELDNRKG